MCLQENASLDTLVFLRQKKAAGSQQSLGWVLALSCLGFFWGVVWDLLLFFLRRGSEGNIPSAQFASAARYIKSQAHA